MPKILFIVNGLHSHYLAVVPFIKLLAIEPAFLIMNGYKEDTKLIEKDIRENGWTIVDSATLRSNVSKLHHGNISLTFTPKYQQARDQISLLKKILLKVPYNQVCIESFNTTAVTAAQQCKLNILSFRIFFLQPRVSYRNTMLEAWWNKIVSFKELSGVNLYRISKAMRPIGSLGYESNYININPCYRWYCDTRLDKTNHFFIGPMISLEAKDDHALSSFVEHKEETILITFGTTVKDDKTVEKLSFALAERGKKVIIAGAETLSFSHPNIYHRSWLPLASVKDKIAYAIIHGGANTTAFMVEMNIPMVVVPYFGDQFAHADRIVKLGFGKKASHKSVEKILRKCKEIENELIEISSKYQDYSKNSDVQEEISRLRAKLAD